MSILKAANQPISSPLLLTGTVLLLLATLLYLPALANDYAWDDLTLIYQPNGYSSEDWLLHAITQPLPFSDNYFRPLVSLLLSADFHYGGTNPQISHAISLGLFLTNGLILLLIIQSLCRKLALTNQQSALYGGGVLAFYLLHTSLIESTVWIAGRFDLMVTTFLLLALLADTTMKKPGKRAVGVGVCFLLAALCKEMAVFFLPCLVVWHYLLATTECYQPPSRYIREIGIPRHLPVYMAIVASGVIYLLLRYTALGYLLVEEAGLAERYGTPLQHLAVFGKSWFLYLKMLFLPFLDVSHQHPQDFPVPAGDPAALTGVLLLLLLVIGILTARSQKTVLLLLPFLLFFTAIFPVLHLLPLKIGDNIIHDRFLAFPAALFAAASLPALSRLGSGISQPLRKLSLPLLAAWCLVATTTIHSIVPLWSNSLTLWRWSYLKYRTAPMTEIYAQALFNAGHLEDAYQLSLSVTEKSSFTYLLLGNIQLKREQYPEALGNFAIAIEKGINKNNLAFALAHSGFIRVMQGDLDNAEKLLQESNAIQPDKALTLHYLACLHYQRADFASARAALQQAILHTPAISNSRNQYERFLQNIDVAEASYHSNGQLPLLQDVLLPEKVPEP